MDKRERRSEALAHLYTDLGSQLKTLQASKPNIFGQQSLVVSALTPFSPPYGKGSVMVLVISTLRNLIESGVDGTCHCAKTQYALASLSTTDCEMDVSSRV